jgi:hypothetical protein
MQKLSKCVYLLLLAVPVVVWCQRSLGDEEASPSGDRYAECWELVQQLGDEQFAVRERAMTRLIEIGLPAREALLDGRKHADREIRYRCERIASLVEELDFQRRLSSFSAGRSDGHDLPGWKQYRTRFGDDAEIRALFVEMQEAESDLMQAVANGPQGVQNAVRERCLLLQQAQRSGGQPITPGNIAALLFAVGEADVNLDMQSTSMLYTVCRQPAMNEAMSDRSRGKILRKMLGSWIESSDGWAAYQTLFLAMQYELKEGLVPARKLLENPAEQPYARQQAILTVAKLGDDSYIELLESLLDDPSRCTAHRINNVTYETQVRDVALAAILIMEKQDPKKFGFDRIQMNPSTSFSTSTVGFPNDDVRKKVFDKYAEYKTRQADSQEP